MWSVERRARRGRRVSRARGARGSSGALRAPVAPAHALLGCHISDTKNISGGWLGKVSGNFISALKKPPSHAVPVGPTIIIVQ